MKGKSGEKQSVSKAPKVKQPKQPGKREKIKTAEETKVGKVAANKTSNESTT